MSTPISPTNRTPKHLSGHLHVSGQSKFIGEIQFENTCYAKSVGSKFAHARILNIDTTAAENIPGVLAVLTHHDIPGENMIGHVQLDEPLFPVAETQYIGQPVAIVVAESEWLAEQGANAVVVSYEPLHPVLTTTEAIEKDLLYIPARKIERGDLAAGFAAADHILTADLHTGGQEHFYLETQRCVAVPNEDGDLTLYSSTQSTSEVQEVCARILGKSSNDVTVDVARLGGGFGGKERTPVLWACLAALAANHVHRPVSIILNRLEDMITSGKRHPFDTSYKIGFTNDGKITAYSIELNANGGAYCDLSLAILDRAIMHADGCYHFSNVSITGRACRTNLPPNTAFRGFGAPQGFFAIEHAIDRIAETLGKDPFEVRIRNAYQDGERTPYLQPVQEAATVELLEKLKTDSHYQELVTANDEFNRTHSDRKRGIGVVPSKFGISFTASFLNQGSALLWIYTDGSISLSHGGIEMGQEVNTKVAQVAARTLGVSVSRIRIETANTKRVGNASPTAASSGSDINGNAARVAAEELRTRLSEVATKLWQDKFHSAIAAEKLQFDNDLIFDPEHPERSLAFATVVHEAYLNRVPLGAHGFYKTPRIHFDRANFQGSPFYYFVYGCGLVEVELDLVDGTFTIRKAHLVHEIGRSINPEIDRGQISGAFLQGVGWCTFEELPFHPETGAYLAVSPSTYKIPTIKDMPLELTIDLVERDREFASVYQSKGVGEPPLIYGLAAYFAIKDAIAAAVERKTSVSLAHPATPNAVILALEAARETIKANRTTTNL